MGGRGHRQPHTTVSGVPAVQLDGCLSSGELNARSLSTGHRAYLPCGFGHCPLVRRGLAPEARRGLAGAFAFSICLMM